MLSTCLADGMAIQVFLKDLSQGLIKSICSGTKLAHWLPSQFLNLATQDLFIMLLIASFWKGVCPSF